jgi:hypothetical protein
LLNSKYACTVVYTAQLLYSLNSKGGQVSYQQLEQNALALVEQLVQTLRAMPGVEAEMLGADHARTDRGARHDARIAAHFAGRPVTVLVEAKKSAFPRDVHQALWRLKAMADGNRSGIVVAVLAADSLSPGAKELLRAEGVGYFDSGGSLYLPADGAYVYIDRPPPKAHVSAMRSLFAERRAQAIHALLVKPGQWFSVKALAALSQVSPSTASEVLTELDKFDWIDSRGQGPSKERFLRNPKALLDAWAAQVTASRAPDLRRYFVPGLKADALVDQAAKSFEARNVDYAFSHEAAAQRYTPYLSSLGQVRCRLLAAPAVADALAELGARPVSEGANFAIIEVKSAGGLLFRERQGNAWLASPIHVYLDLLRGEGRAKEMAEHLRKERIRC